MKTYAWIYEQQVYKFKAANDRRALAHVKPRLGNELCFDGQLFKKVDPKDPCLSEAGYLRLQRELLKRT
jgi:hypothetical protein